MEFPELKSFWLRSQQTKSSGNGNWNAEMQALSQLGIGMEDALHFLYNQQPTLADFYAWLNKRSVNYTLPDTSNTPDVLSAEDLLFWEQNGYIVLKNAIPRADCEAACQAMWEFLDMNPQQPQSWYKSSEGQRGLMLTLSKHPSLQNNRISARIKKAFEQLYKSNAIYLLIDKVSFNPPEQHGYHFAGDGLHWDVSLKQPISFGTQGLLYLTDCSENDGAFQCVPGFHIRIGEWLNQVPPTEPPRGYAQKTLKGTTVPGKAGDMVIWHQALPHSATPNRGEFPRMVQYINYKPTDYIVATEWL